MSDILPDLSNMSGNRFFLGPIGVFKFVTFQLPLGDCRPIESILEFVTFQLPLGDCNKDSLIFVIFVGVINILSSSSKIIVKAVKINILIISYLYITFSHVKIKFSLRTRFFMINIRVIVY